MTDDAVQMRKARGTGCAPVDLARGPVAAINFSSSVIVPCQNVGKVNYGSMPAAALQSVLIPSGTVLIVACASS